MNSMRIAVIPGDRIGKEVVPEGLRVLHAAATRFDFVFVFQRVLVEGPRPGYGWQGQHVGRRGGDRCGGGTDDDLMSPGDRS